MKSSIASLKRAFFAPLMTFAVMLLFGMITYTPVWAQQIFAGPDGYAACAIDASGNLYTWGIDQYLHTVVSKTGGNAQDLTPVQVGFPAGVTSWTSASVGYLFTLAIGNDGDIYGWGLNSDGQLGNGTTTDSNVPVMVTLPSGVKARAVSAGEDFAVAVGTDGNVYAWGLNSSGQLGDSTTTNSDVPVLVKMPSGVTATTVFAGPAFALAIGSDGNIYAWGANSTGQLGDSTATNSSVPVMVKMPSGVTATAISAGSSFSLAIGSDGNAYAWGGNGFGQLGDSTKTNSSVPVMVDLPSGVTAKAIAGGRLHSLAVGSNGIVYGWGSNIYGGLGTDTVNVPSTEILPTPVSLPAGLTAAGVTAIRWSSYMLGSNDSVYACGYNQEGELGIGSATGSPEYGVPTPTAVSDLVLVSPVVPALTSPANGAVDQPTTIVLKWSGSPLAIEYQCQVSTDSTFKADLFVNDSTLADSSDTVSGLTADTVYYWHVRSYVNGIFSAYSTVSSFKTVAAAPSGPDVYAGPDGYAGCAIDAKGNLYTWGIDQYFQSIVSTTSGHTQDLTPVQVGFPTGVTAWTSASVGYLFTLAIGNDGNIYGWGLNSDGQLGNGTTTNSNVPVMVSLPAGVEARAVSAGEDFAVAVGTDGNVYAWGLNSSGQLGDSTTTNSNVPVMAKMPSGVTATSVFAGPAFALAIGSDGNVYAWGGNYFGELGDSTNTNSSVPVMVKLPEGVKATSISAGSSFSLAIGSDGNVYAWGGGGFGQLGDGAEANTNVPVMVELPSGVTAKSIAGGRLFASAIGSDGNVYTWGDNLYGELGDGTVDVPKTDSLPVVVKLPRGVTATGITAIRWSGFAMGNDYHVYAWGYNQEGELGIGSGTGGPKYGIGLPAMISGLVLGTPAVQPPAVPQLISPSDGVTGVPRKATLVWHSSNGSSSYQLQISTDSLFTTVAFDTTTADTSVELSTPLAADTLYYWHVGASDSAGASPYSAVDSFETGKGLTAVEEPSGLPRQFSLSQNYPNPFNPSTTIKYALPKAQLVILKIYNVLGQEVATLVNGEQAAGYYQVNFNADRLASGVYFYVLRTQSFSSVHKMLLLK